MKISNFQIICEKQGPHGRQFFATIDIETGLLLWKKKETVEVFSAYGGIGWRFLDSGRIAPELVLEQLYEAYVAKKLMQS